MASFTPWPAGQKKDKEKLAKSLRKMLTAAA
jgi:hypothetical protein